MRRFVFPVLLCLASPAVADFVPVQDKATFLSLMDGKVLREALLGITIDIEPDGTITGNAVRWGVTGSWYWEDAYFCREMDWSGMEIPFNCQLVEVDGDRMRFTVDQGAGDSATFNLR